MFENQKRVSISQASNCCKAGLRARHDPWPYELLQNETSFWVVDFHPLWCLFILLLLRRTNTFFTIGHKGVICLIVIILPVQWKLQNRWIIAIFTGRRKYSSCRQKIWSQQTKISLALEVADDITKLGFFLGVNATVNKNAKPYFSSRSALP